MKSILTPITTSLSLFYPTIVFAGLMRTDIDVQTYRDFAENRGVFKAGAENVTIYKSDGSVSGVISVMPDFSAVNDGGYMTMFNASFGGSVDHVTYTTSTTFSRRFNDTGLAYSLFGDTYKQVASIAPSGFDYKISRYNKIFIDAAPLPMTVDEAYLQAMGGKQIARAGGGSQAVAVAPGVEAAAYPNASNYGWLSGGLNRVDGVSRGASTQTVDGVTSQYYMYTVQITVGANPDAPLEIGTMAGDSGSPVLAWNTNTNRYEIIAFNQAGAGGGIGKYSFLRAAPIWTQDQVNSFDSATVFDNATDGIITMSTTNATGGGVFSQGQGGWFYSGLGTGKTSATATNAELNAAKSVTFAGTGNTIRLDGSVDLGAGSMTFQGNGTYIIEDGGNTNTRLNSAGYIVDGSTTLVSRVTGSAGDDWRKIGTGTLRIEGTGNSDAKLSLGEGLVVLNRSGGYAVNDVLITSGRGTVRTEGADQINGVVSFGRSGGTLDLYGNDFSRNVVYALDGGASIANTKAGTTSTFSWTGSGSGLEQIYRGGFTDGGSEANGLLRVAINPTTAANSVLTLRGNSTNMGGFQVNGGEVVLRGFITPHAGDDGNTKMKSFPDDWMYASIATSDISVASGAKFTLADHARLDGNVTVSNGGTFAITENVFKSQAESVGGALPGTPSATLYGHQSGNVSLNGSNAAMIATVSGQTDQKMVYERAISGTGSFTKNGSGTLTLSGANTFSGAKTHTDGTLIGTSLDRLGDTTTNKWNLTKTSAVIAAQGATARQVADKVTTNSVGTIALHGSNPDAAPDLLGSPDLFLGALGNQTVGVEGTTATLTAWNNGGWNLGGGGGNLTMNSKLSGAGQLTIGNGSNFGTVTLTNIHNSDTLGGDAFTGVIKVNQGVSLQVTDVRALGVNNGSGNLLVDYGAQLSLGSHQVAMFDRVQNPSKGVLAVTGNDASNYSFANRGMNDAVLGADGVATYSGQLTTGTNGYKFGGSGDLSVMTNLTGANSVHVDGQGMVGGITRLNGTNSFQGDVTVMGGVVNGRSGSHTLSVGSSSALSSNNALILQDNGTLDVNGQTVSVKSLTGSALSGLSNQSATAGTLVVDGGDTTVMGGAISNQVNLVKNGTGKLTLSGSNTQTGTVAVNQGILAFGSNNALGASTNAVTVQQGGSIDLATFSSNAGITIAGTGVGTQGALHKSTAVNSTLARVTLAENASITGVGKSSEYSIGAINLGGKTLTLTDARINFASDTSVTDGNMIVNNSVLYSNGSQSGAGSSGTLTLNAGTEWGLRDFNNTTTTNKKSVVLNGGKITNGSSTFVGGNGGGSRSTLANDIQVGAGGGALDGNSWLFNLSILSTGTITGQGQLSILGSMGAEIAGNTSSFTGNVAIGAGSKLSMNGVANQELKGNISGGGALIKAGSTTLMVFGNNNYTGTTSINGGQLVAGSNTAFGTGRVTVNSGAILNTGLAGAGMNVNNAITLNSGGAIMGAGTIGTALQVNTGAMIRPGNSPGVLSFANGGNFLSGSLYEWQISGVGNVAGVDYDQIMVLGGVMNLTSGSIVQIQGQATDYSNAYWAQNRTFNVITTSGAGQLTGGFTVLDTSLAGNTLSFGSWSLLTQGNGSQQAMWTVVPEPSTALMALSGLVVVFYRRRAE